MVSWWISHRQVSIKRTIIKRTFYKADTFFGTKWMIPMKWISLKRTRVKKIGFSQQRKLRVWTSTLFMFVLNINSHNFIYLRHVYFMQRSVLFFIISNSFAMYLLIHITLFVELNQSKSLILLVHNHKIYWIAWK